MPYQDRSKGLLGKMNESQVGKSFLLSPARIAANQVGSTFVFQDFPTSVKPAANADEQSNGENISIVIAAAPLSNVPVGANGVAEVLQAKLRWGTGESRVGDQQDPPNSTIGGVAVPFSEIVLVDVGYGTVLTIPGATYLDVQLRLNGYNYSPGFALNDRWGSDYRCNIGVSYGGLSAFSDGAALTMTQYAQDPLVTAHSISFTKPLFATAFRLMWENSPPIAAGLAVSFQGSFSPLQSFDYSSPLRDGFPLIPWPAGAVAVNVTNVTGANVNFITLVNYLTL